MRPRTLSLILVLLVSTGVQADELDLIGVFEWETQSIIGLSGIEVGSDGVGFTAIGDKGWWLQGKFDRKGEAISNLQISRIEGIIGQDGLPVSARQVGDWSDAEGLAIAPNGRAWIAFERWAHVWWYQKPFERGNWIKDHPTFYDHAENWQLEAAAIAPDGTVYVFSERPLIEGFPIYRLGRDDLWHIDGYLPEEDVFGIVGADFDQDGALYILERKLVVGLWWQSRIRRIQLDGSENIILWTSERGEYANLEGISVWQDEIGLRLTLVSDNNGSSSVATQFVEFRLTE